jgi:hypothetical protein
MERTGVFTDLRSAVVRDIEEAPGRFASGDGYLRGVALCAVAIWSHPAPS